ncbi:phosphatase PAP2 family protein [Saccharomonospora azurea]|uniref:phosphatase PAP2 family protein n=1 Tax=Saccharomonospora azurea TaxID=40988 RepID=UPI00332633BE
MPVPVSQAVSVARSLVPADSGGLAAPEDALEVDGVPDFSAEWYRAVLDAANAAPGWLQDFAVFFTEAGIVVLGLLLILGWWRARTGSASAMAAAVSAPMATVVAYGTSEVAKLFIQEDRPCRAVPGARPLTECPELGDWSFPSNHSTIAGAAAMGVFLCRRGRVGLAALLLGASVAFSRVVVGAHYPHDVVVGFALGVAVVAAALAVTPRWTVPLVERYRPHRLGVLLLGPGEPAPAPADDTPKPEELDDATQVIARPVPEADPSAAPPTQPIPHVPHWPSESAHRTRQRRPLPPQRPAPPRTSQRR